MWQHSTTRCTLIQFDCVEIVLTLNPIDGRGGFFLTCTTTHANNLINVTALPSNEVINSFTATAIMKRN
ncbi:MAG: hypothetical protein ACTS82_00595 [Arsenophonus sp. ET-DL12-MAG3]